MAVWAILLRGVNVGGAGKLPMAEWRALMAEQGFERPETYIQSGNAVIATDLDRPEVEHRIADGIEARFGFRPEVMARNLAEMRVLCDGHPYRSEDAARVHAFVLGRPADPVDAAAIDALKAADEAWHLTDGAFYLSAPSGIGRSVLAARIGRILGVPTTARNLRSMAAVLAMAEAR